MCVLALEDGNIKEKDKVWWSLAYIITIHTGATIESTLVLSIYLSKDLRNNSTTIHTCCCIRCWQCGTFLDWAWFYKMGDEVLQSSLLYQQSLSGHHCKSDLGDARKHEKSANQLGQGQNFPSVNNGRGRDDRGVSTCRVDRALVNGVVLKRPLLQQLDGLVHVLRRTHGAAREADRLFEEPQDVGRTHRVPPHAREAPVNRKRNRFYE